jgi:hypothetical protein
MSSHLRSSSWMPFYNGVEAHPLPRSARCVTSHSPIHRVFPDKTFIFLADGRLRGERHPCLQTTTRAHSTNGSGGQSHWKRRARAEIRKIFRDARQTQFRHILFFVVSVTLPHTNASPLSFVGHFVFRARSCLPYMFIHF